MLWFPEPEEYTTFRRKDNVLVLFAQCFLKSKAHIQGRQVFIKNATLAPPNGAGVAVKPR
jgi:hypothetical protein